MDYENIEARCPKCGNMCRVHFDDHEHEDTTHRTEFICQCGARSPFDEISFYEPNGNIVREIMNMKKVFESGHLGVDNSWNSSMNAY